MKTFTRRTIAAVTVLFLIGCQSNPSTQQITHVKVAGFTPFGVTGGYDVGSLIDYSNQNYKTLFTSEYIEQNAKPEAQDMLYKLFHTPLTPVSPSYNDNQKKQFMGAIQRVLHTGDFNLSANAKAAIDKIDRVDITVRDAVKKSAAAPEELQYQIIEAIPPRGGTIIGITTKTGMAETPVAVSSILVFNQATVTIYFDSSVSSAERIEIFDKIHFENRVVIKLGSMKNNSIMIEYTKPTIVAFKGFSFDKQSARFYMKNGRLPTPEESQAQALTTAKYKKRKEQNKAHADIHKNRDVNETGMINRGWSPSY